MNLTQEQQAAAASGCSITVTAGAGTGKTFMLAQRYLHHLEADQLSPLQVVAVTYTDRAAAELRARIRKVVAKQFADSPQYLAELEAAQISTLHALAARICREFPDIAGVPADFTALDEVEGKLWQAERLEEALDALPAEIYEAIPYTNVKSAIEAFLADPQAAQDALLRDRQDWEGPIREIQQQALATLLANQAWQGAVQTLALYSGKPDDKLEVLRQAAMVAAAALQQGGSPRQHLTTLKKAGSNLGKKENWKQGGLDEIRQAMGTLNALARDALAAGMVTLEWSLADDMLLAMLPPLREAFATASKQLQAAKRRARVLDFADMEVHALRALADPEVRAYYAQRWQAFLIDEFQDTNPVQAQILAPLIRDKRVTIVGDAKQSIYGFRRADVTVFNRFQTRIEALGGRTHLLSLNFRTHAALLNSINCVFRPLLPDARDLQAARAEMPHAGPHLQVLLVHDEVGELQDPRQRFEARQIARLIDRMHAAKILIHDKGQLRAICYKDIAILSRSWAPLLDYGEALEAAGIPAVHAGGGDLMGTREAKDVWALLRFLADPGDDLALAAVLRSPFFAVSDTALFVFAQATAPGQQRNWWHRLQQSLQKELLWPKEVLGKLIQERRTALPSQLLQLANRWTGYTAIIGNLAGATRREADWRGMIDFVRKLEQQTGDIFNVARRLHHLLKAEIELPRPPLEAADAVSLMTIHKAKGLEWPVVIVPALAKGGKNDHPVILMDSELGVALKLKDDKARLENPMIYRVLKSRMDTREEAEERRILYVALTRARDRVILTAAKQSGEKLEVLRPGLDEAGIEPELISFDREQARPPILPTPKPLAAPARVLQAPLGNGLFELPATALNVYDRCPKQFQYRFCLGHPGLSEMDGTNRRIGSLTHLALERGIQDVSSLARQDRTLHQEHVKEAMRLARVFWKSQTYASMQGRITAQEYPVILRLEAMTIYGLVDGVGTDFVLDFKTTRDSRPDQHRFQLWAYARALGKPAAYIAYLRQETLAHFDETKLETIGLEAKHLVSRIQDGEFSARPSAESCNYCPYAAICEDKV